MRVEEVVDELRGQHGGREIEVLDSAKLHGEDGVEVLVVLTRDELALSDAGINSSGVSVSQRIAVRTLDGAAHSTLIAKTKICPRST